jgi:hypothetical protein
MCMVCKIRISLFTLPVTYALLLYGFSKLSLLIGSVVHIFRIWTGVPDVVYLAGNFCFTKRKNFCFLNFQLCFTDKNFKQPNCFWLSMHAYRILLPSETDDSRFNSREKRMLTHSVQPYNKPIIDLACSVCTVKYQTYCMFFAWTSLLRRSVHAKKPRSDISQYRPHARSIRHYYY